jgi:hypothetical protein
MDLLVKGTEYPGYETEARETIPGKNDKTSPEMRIYDPPHKSLKLEDYVGDIEYCQQPAVSIAFQVQIFFHASDFGVADVRAIKEGEKICHGGLMLARNPFHSFVSSPSAKLLLGLDSHKKATRGGTCQSSLRTTRFSSSESML